MFADNHGFSLSQTGLSFLGILAGMGIGIASDPLWKRQYANLVQQNEVRRANEGGEKGAAEAVPEPEFRLPPAVWGAWLVPVGLFGEFLLFPCRILLCSTYSAYIDVDSAYSFQ